mmetsp:Transcript_67561/g.159074  ORF Transcript_67561/g.159074 Transcript_67561/m.159074 type:complete len:237 (-) Transcript_67561:128-838(-)
MRGGSISPVLGRSEDSRCVGTVRAGSTMPGIGCAPCAASSAPSRLNAIASPPKRPLRLWLFVGHPSPSSGREGRRKGARANRRAGRCRRWTASNRRGEGGSQQRLRGAWLACFSVHGTRRPWRSSVVSTQCRPRQSSMAMALPSRLTASSRISGRRTRRGPGPMPGSVLRSPSQRSTATCRGEAWAGLMCHFSTMMMNGRSRRIWAQPSRSGCGRSNCGRKRPTSRNLPPYRFSGA